MAILQIVVLFGGLFATIGILFLPARTRQSTGERVMQNFSQTNFYKPMLIAICVGIAVWRFRRSSTR